MILLNENEKKENNQQSGYILIELMLWLAILLTIATPFLRYLYREEIEQFENQFFQTLGIGEVGRFLITSFLVIAFIYLEIRQNIIESKRRNSPFIGKLVKIFSILAFLLIGVLLALSFI